MKSIQFQQIYIGKICKRVTPCVCNTLCGYIGDIPKPLIKNVAKL